MIGSKVDLCYEQMECKLQPISSRCKKFKMIVYIDSTECTPCALSHLRYWNPIIYLSYKGVSISIGSCTNYSYAVIGHCYDGGNRDECTSSKVLYYI